MNESTNHNPYIFNPRKPSVEEWIEQANRNKLFQDEPGYGAQGLGKWFASRLGARQALRNIFTKEQ
jgi:hypothetical protein